MEFYGSSFVTDWRGRDRRAGAARRRGGGHGSFDLDELASARAAWGLFRDRRPDLYVPILSVDGEEPVDLTFADVS